MRKRSGSPLRPVPRVYAIIPTDRHHKNELANFDGYCTNIFYSYFAALGLDMPLNDTLNNGRIDIAVLHEGQVYLIKFNVMKFAPERRALQPIKDKGYADKYRARGESNYLIGKEFSKTSRNILGFEVATLLFK